MDQKSLYERLGGFGRTAATMVSAEISNCRLTIYVPAPAARCTTRAEI